ncbi:o-succinylbenzoate--CoA ligase [Actinobacillus porcitonsillarum]|uniref:O-succinylbenzoate--CoA ligase n=1 Tax=Actinobacillus porcitonsillarum TaxID=189834 RepID=A0A2U8FKK0_9PAST|nr:o-succinylbenzoate--CoA ligase [Actinobacillus porcitonsillarum]AWI51560.1 o-succinylbenzoate--CoA ligase [Actinobacillus porcitonsillarum]
MGNFSSFMSEHWAKMQPHHTAIVWRKGKCPYLTWLPETLNWQKFHHLIKQVSAFLSSQPDFHSAQVIAYSGSCKLIGVLCYCATIAQGKKILMLNPALTSSQQQNILEDNGVDILITDQHFAEFSEKQTACALLPCDWSQPSTLTLTSGSSGTPKAIVHSVENHLANAEGVCELMQFEAAHAWLLSLPLFHVSGQGILWRWLFKGASLFIHEDKADFFEMLSLVTHASLVPTQLQRYLTQTTALIGQNQKCLLGGSAIPPELVEQAQQRGICCFSGYGMTEMASTICAVENALDNVGLPLKGRAVKIVENEIWVKGTMLGLGYWQKDGQIRPLVNEEGWLQTKDRGAWNSQGQLVVKGRLDNMFISGGENIQPEEVEKVLFQSGMVKQVFVVPRDDEEFGQRPVAFVDFIEPFNTQAVEKLQNFARLHLEKFKQPVCYFALNTENAQQGGIKISRKQLKSSLVQQQV